MSTESPLLLALDLGGTFAFALNGALTAIRVAKLDVVGVVTLGMVTALGGGVIRDIFIDSLPPSADPKSASSSGSGKCRAEGSIGNVDQQWVGSPKGGWRERLVGPAHGAQGSRWSGRYAQDPTTRRTGSNR